MKIHASFTARMEKVDSKGGWTYVIWPESIAFFGTKGTVKVVGTIDGHPLRATFMAMGDGKQMLPIKKETRDLIKKDAGDTVSITLTEILES